MEFGKGQLNGLMNGTKIYLQSNSIRPIINSEIFFSFFYLDVESLVTYPNNQNHDRISKFKNIFLKNVKETMLQHVLEYDIH